MQRIGFLLKVKSDCLEEYKQRHREAWPEMLAALKECGWCNYCGSRQEGPQDKRPFSNPMLPVNVA